MNAVKLARAVLALACITGAAAFSVEEIPMPIDVPAGDLIEGLEALAKQSRVDIVYPSESLKGQKTQGVSGMLQPRDAFRKLLEGTSLTLREESGALLVTEAAGASALEPAQNLDNLLPQVEIEARRVKLSAMRAELDRLEDRFFAEYNKLNDIAAYRVDCERVGSLRAHVCRPAFIARQSWSGGYLGGLYENLPSLFTIWVSPLDYKAHMVDLVSKHPELFELLKERSELAKRYETLRRQKLNGKTFVWD